MTDKTELKPCPMCGGEAGRATTKYDARTVREQEWDQDTFHYINCTRCGLNNAGIVGGVKTPELAAELWNRRPAVEAAPDSAELKRERHLSRDLMDLLKSMFDAPTMAAGYAILADFSRQFWPEDPVSLRAAPDLTETAKRIAWGYWMAHSKPSTVTPDADRYWERMGEWERKGFLSAARAVSAPAAAPLLPCPNPNCENGEVEWYGADTSAAKCPTCKGDSVVSASPAAPAAQSGEGWRDVASLTSDIINDGNIYLLTDGNSVLTGAISRNDWGDLYFPTSDLESIAATHWMPLPSAPAPREA